MANKISWYATGKGNIQKLAQKSEPLLPLEEGKIRIEVKSIGLNFADIFAILGLYSAAPKPPFIPGLEYSGVVSDITGTSPFNIGDKVIGITRFGGYSTHVDIEPQYCIKVPESWSFEQGAAYLVQTLTAWYSLKHLGNIQKDQNVLISSAAGGVGLQAMKLCRAVGANPIGTVSATEKKRFLNNLDFNDIIIRSAQFDEDLTELSKHTPIHLALDAIGGHVQKSMFKHLHPMGRLIVFGSADFITPSNRINIFKSIYKFLKRPKYDPLKMVEFNKSVMGFNLIWLWNELELLETMLNELNNIQIDSPHVGKQFHFNTMPDALKHLKSGKSIGKVVVNISEA